MRYLHCLVLIATLLIASPAWATTYFVAGTGGATTGNDANACTDWSIPCATVAGALGKATPTIIAVDKTGAFVATAAITWTPPGTGIAIISSTNGVTGTTIAYATGASESVGAASAAFSIAGANNSSMYIYGMTLVGGTNNNVATVFNMLATPSVNSKLELDTCSISIPSVHAAAVLNFGHTASGAVKGLEIRSKNTTFTFASKTTPAFVFNAAQVEIINPTLVFGASKVSPLISGGTGVSTIGTVKIRDADIVSYTGAALVGVATIETLNITLENLKISATPTIKTGTWTQGNGSILLRNVDSGDTIYTYQYETAYGSMVTENTDYVTTAGTTFNGSPVAWKIITSSLANEYSPFRLPLLFIWNTTTTAQTYAIEFAQVNGAAALTDRQIWSNIDYAASASFPNYSWQSNRSAGPFVTTGVAHATSTNPWTVPNIGASPVTQKLQSGTATTPASFTAAEVGLLQAQIAIGVGTLTMWLNPTIDGVQ